MAMDDTGLLSINQYTADGSQTQFELSFAGGYLNRDHVHVMVFSDDTLSDGVSTPFVWVSDFQISITPAVASGKIIRIYRQTPYDRPQVDFSDGSIINEKTLDLNAEQAVFLAAELRDRYGLSYEIEGIGETVAAGIAASEAAIAAKESLEELQDDVNVILGPDGASNLGFDVDVTNSVSRSVAEKLRDVVSVKDFGAKGDGTTDDTVAIQNAIDAFKPTVASPPNRGKAIHIPAGTYIVTAPIKVYSGIKLSGDGAGSILKAGPGLTTQVVEIAGLSGTSPGWANRQSQIENLKISCTGTVRAIKSTARQYLEGVIRNIIFDSAYCLDLRPGTDEVDFTYTQSCTFEKLTSVGSTAAGTATEQFIALRGKRNTFKHINKENDTGTGSDPLIYCKASDSNIFEDILLEGKGGANKNAWLFTAGCDKNVVRDYWQEFTTATAGYAYVVEDKSELYLEGYQMLRTHADCAIKANTDSWVYIDHLDTSSEAADWNLWIDADDSSQVIIRRVTTRDGRNLQKMRPNVTFYEAINKQFRDTDVPVGFNQYMRPEGSGGQNLLVNGSFEVDDFGWTVPSAWTTVEYVDSEVGLGKMLHASMASAGGVLAQNITIPASFVGEAMTLRYRAKCEGACFLVARMANVSITSYQRVMTGQGWEDVSVTFRPQTSGNLGFGWQLVNDASASGTPEVWIDEASLTVGSSAVLSPNKFGSVQIGGLNIAVAAAAPNKGTWSVGDRVFNSAAAVGQPQGWVCIASGSPGTWTSMGNL